MEQSTIDIERSNIDWVYCKVEENVFKGAGGPKNQKFKGGCLRITVLLYPVVTKHGSRVFSYLLGSSPSEKP